MAKSREHKITDFVNEDESDEYRTKSECYKIVTPHPTFLNFYQEQSMYYVYILQDKLTKEIYIGFSKNLVQRLRTHQKQNKNWVLIYYEAYRSEKAARDRERRLKLYAKSLSNLKRRIRDCFF